MHIRPRRSVLYMPGSNARALEKAKALPADSLILDLEDAVAPDQKEAARALVCEAVRAGGYGARELVIRINGLDTPWGAADLAAAVAARPDAVLVPKVEGAEHVGTIMCAMSQASAAPQIALWAMIETPRGVLWAGEAAAAGFAQTHNRLACFVVGTNDLVKATRAEMDADRTSALYWLSATVTAARAFGLDVVDGVYNNFKDMDGFTRECEAGRRLGMDGKTLIHPDQVPVANRVFQPSEAEVAWSRKIIAAFGQPENAGKGAITLDGRMVELLHADTARRTVAIAEAIAARESAP